MDTGTESVHSTEVNISVTAEQLSDNNYIKRLLVSTKMKVLFEIAECNDSSITDLAKEHCNEVYNYSDLLEKYNITPNETTKKKKLKMVLKKTKPAIKIATPPETHSEVKTALSPKTTPSPTTTVTEITTPVTEVTTPETEVTTPVTEVTTPVTEVTTSPSSKKPKKKKILRKKPVKQVDSVSPKIDVS